MSRPSIDARIAYGRPAPNGRGVVRTYGEARPCSFPACPTVLSRYNENERCWAHLTSALPTASERPR